MIITLCNNRSLWNLWIEGRTLFTFCPWRFCGTVHILIILGQFFSPLELAGEWFDFLCICLQHSGDSLVAWRSLSKNCPASDMMRMGCRILAKAPIGLLGAGNVPVESCHVTSWWGDQISAPVKAFWRYGISPLWANASSAAYGYPVWMPSRIMNWWHDLYFLPGQLWFKKKLKLSLFS